jgi:hypothetical protein
MVITWLICKKSIFLKRKAELIQTFQAALMYLSVFATSIFSDDVFLRTNVCLFVFFLQEAFGLLLTQHRE